MITRNLDNHSFDINAFQWNRNLKGVYQEQRLRHFDILPQSERKDILIAIMQVLLPFV